MDFGVLERRAKALCSVTKSIMQCLVIFRLLRHCCLSSLFSLLNVCKLRQIDFIRLLNVFLKSVQVSFWMLSVCSDSDRATVNFGSLKARHDNARVFETVDP